MNEHIRTIILKANDTLKIIKGCEYVLKNFENSLLYKN